MVNISLTNMKGMRFKIICSVVKFTIFFLSAPKWFLCFHNGPHVKNQLPDLMHLWIQLDTLNVVFK